MKITESINTIIIEALDGDGAHRRFYGSRVYIGCGVLETLKLLQNSIPSLPKAVKIKTNQHFIFPMIQLRGAKGVENEKLHTLAQLFIEITGINDNLIHLQVYSYNDMYASLLEKKLGHLFFRLFKPLIHFILGRLLIVQGYLHSDNSPKILASFDEKNKIKLKPIQNLESKILAKRVVSLINSNAIVFKAIAIPFLNIVGLPGEGAHVGGSFPMSANPKEFETDKFGRIHGCQRIHIVDASIFPTLPSTTITLSIMANAYRIGSQYNLYNH